jgi:hypothetical protein
LLYPRQKEQTSCGRVGGESNRTPSGGEISPSNSLEVKLDGVPLALSVPGAHTYDNALAYWKPPFSVLAGTGVNLISAPYLYSQANIAAPNICSHCWAKGKFCLRMPRRGIEPPSPCPTRVELNSTLRQLRVIGLGEPPTLF